MISTAKRLTYAEGYIGLGMVNEAADELEQIAFADDRDLVALWNRIGSMT
jgi:hypothetical protein